MMVARLFKNGGFVQDVQFCMSAILSEQPFSIRWYQQKYWVPGTILDREPQRNGSKRAKPSRAEPYRDVKKGNKFINNL